MVGRDSVRSMRAEHLLTEFHHVLMPSEYMAVFTSKTRSDGADQAILQISMLV